MTLYRLKEVGGFISDVNKALHWKGYDVLNRVSKQMNSKHKQFDDQTFEKQNIGNCSMARGFSSEGRSK